MPHEYLSLNFVIPTAAYPDFLLRATTMASGAAFRKESRMKFANATKHDRKSGVAKWRDLQFSFDP
jgi:hypothetical protein